MKKSLNNTTPAKQDDKVVKNSIFRIFYLYLYIKWFLANDSVRSTTLAMSWTLKFKLFTLNDHHPILSKFHCIHLTAYNIYATGMRVMIVSIFSDNQKLPNMQTKCVFSHHLSMRVRFFTIEFQQQHLVPWLKVIWNAENAYMNEFFFWFLFLPAKIIYAVSLKQIFGTIMKQ